MGVLRCHSHHPPGARGSEQTPARPAPSLSSVASRAASIPHPRGPRQRWGCCSESPHPVIMPVMGPMGRGWCCPEPLSLWGLRTGTGSGCDQGPATRPVRPLPSEGLSAHVRQVGARGASTGAGQGGGPLTSSSVHGPVPCQGPGPGTGCVSRSLSSGRCSLRSCGRPCPAPRSEGAHV